MSLSAGTRLGPYEITSAIGAGGMGEVYRARDTRLGRDVAVKVLPAELSSDTDRLRRFEQEARSASALNHPNIVTVYDIGRTDSFSYIALELVEGETLREMLTSGPLPIKKTLGVVAQVADGLAKAHAAGIVHRDLKPENVMVSTDGFVKILDFGLAKLIQPEAGKGGESRAPTLAGATEPGVVLGTVGYMSPEQTCGRAVDFRSDQFSFGSILYEIVTGKRAFHRGSAAETLTAIIREEPEPVAAANPLTPAPLRWIVERCLAKDPEDRYASTRDLARDLQGLRDRLSDTVFPSSGPSAPPALSAKPRLSPKSFWAGLTLGLLAGAALIWWIKPPSASEPPALRYLTSSGSDFSPAASPDGRLIAFTSRRDGRPRIWLKQLAGGSEAPLTSGPDDYPRFSPDGSVILFSRTEGNRTALYRVAALGGEPRKLVDDATQGDWSPDGKAIAFLRLRNEGEQQTSAVGLAGSDGGGARDIAAFENQGLFCPRFSPDGGTIAMVRAGFQSGAPGSILLMGLDGKEKRSISLPAVLDTVFSLAWSGSGDAFVYSQNESVSGPAISGTARVVLQSARSEKTRTIFRIPNATRTLDILGPGSLVFDAPSARQNLREIALRGKEAVPETRLLTRGHSTDRQPAYSPDGEWIIFSSHRGGNLDLWTVSRKTGAVRRITDDEAEDWDPAFTADGKRVVWSSRRSGHFEIWMSEADGSNARQLTHDGVDAENPTMTPDGTWVVYNSANPAKSGVWKIRSDGSQATRLVAGTTLLPEVSPDGQYALYLANPQLQGRSVRVVRIANGAAVPFEIELQVRDDRANAQLALGRSRWLPDGRAIAFLAQDEKGFNGVFVQDFIPGQDTAHTRRPLGGFFEEPVTESFGISPDGSRMTVAGWEQSVSLMLAENVPEILPQRRAP